MVTYVIGKQIGEGHFALVYACKDGWGNDLAAKVVKPIASYEEVWKSGSDEVQKLLAVRHPNITAKQLWNDLNLPAQPATPWRGSQESKH